MEDDDVFLACFIFGIIIGFLVGIIFCAENFKKDFALKNNLAYYNSTTGILEYKPDVIH